MAGSGLDKMAFIDFMLAQNVLKFGEFTLNSGRVSPYFFNLGEVNSGAAFAELGRAYASAIMASGLEFDVLFGPAYKGIPIAVATAVALAEQGKNVGVAYNRKEAKDHGEGGMLVGAQVRGRVLMIDDVLTSGKAIRSAAQLIQATDAQIVGVIIAMDREEYQTEKSAAAPSKRVAPESEPAPATAVAQLAEELSAPVISIANLTDLIAYLEQSGSQNAMQALTGMREYQSRYCRV